MQLFRRRSSKQGIIKITNICAVFIYGNYFDIDRNKSYAWLPAAVAIFNPLREKLMRKERGVADHWRCSCSDDEKTQGIIKMTNICAVFMYRNYFNIDNRNTSYAWLPAVVAIFSPLKEKLMKKERGLGVHWRSSYLDDE